MLTLVHKCYVLTHAGDLWVRAHKEMGHKFYPEIKHFWPLNSICG